MQRQYRLLLLTLDRHPFNPRLLHRRPDPAGIRRIVLIAADERLHHPRRQQFHLVTQLL